MRRALSYPLRLIASNAGVNGSVCQQRVMENLDANIGYNAATDVYEDLMAAGIIDPTKVEVSAGLGFGDFQNLFGFSFMRCADRPHGL